MPVKKTIDKARLAPELQVLLPENDLCDVFVGDSCYVLAPLPAGRFEKMANEIIGLAADVFGEIATKAGGDEMLNYALLADAFQKGVSKAIKSGSFVNIIAAALDLDENIVRSEVTMKQAYYIAGCLWKQNFDMSNLSEDARKNVGSLLVTIGVKKEKNDTVYQWADYAIRTLHSLHAGSPSERIELVLKAADGLGLIQKSSPTEDSTPISPSSSGSAESTSPGNAQ